MIILQILKADNNDSRLVGSAGMNEKEGDGWGEKEK